MLKKINCFIIFLIILFSPIISNAEIDYCNFNDGIDALMETAKAYNNQGKQLQYDSYKKNLYATPEDATSKNYIYTVCSGFIFQSYYQTFGIELPETTGKLMKYAEDNKNTNNVVLYLEDENKVEDALGIYTDDSGTEKSRFVKYELIDTYNIQVGDIIVYQNTSGSGHSMLVTEVDKTNRKITIMEGNGNTIKDEEEDFDKDGAISSETLSFKMFKGKEKLAIIRILNSSNFDSNTCKYNYINKDNKEEKFSILTSAQTRLTYPDIGIEKIINSITNQSYATFGDTLTYQLRIVNNSTEQYKNISVVEYVDKNFKIIDSGNAIQVEDEAKYKLTWNNITIEPSKDIILNYSIQIPYDINLLGDIIVSKGKVGDIATSKIETKIGNILTNDEVNKLLKSFEDLSTDATERSYINELYKNAFGLDLGISNFKNTEILKFNNSLASSSLVNYTQLNSNLSKHLYSNFYGLRIASKTAVEKENGKSDRLSVRDFDAWKIYTKSELSDRARTLTVEMLNSGDIILANICTNYNASRDCTSSVDRAYIYLNNTLYRKIGNDDFEEISLTQTTSSSGFDNNKLSAFLRNLVGENYVILRPTIPNIINNEIVEEDVISNPPTFDINFTTATLLIGVLLTIGIFSFIQFKKHKKVIYKKGD